MCCLALLCVSELRDWTCPGLNLSLVGQLSIKYLDSLHALYDQYVYENQDFDSNKALFIIQLVNFNQNYKRYVNKYTFPD